MRQFSLCVAVLVIVLTWTINAMCDDPPPRSVDIRGLLNGYHRFDMDRDGTAEIESIRSIDGLDKLEIPGEQKLMLLIVEKRLLDNDRRLSVGDDSLVRRIQNLRTQMSAEGWCTVTLELETYAGERNQDGLTVLALRRLFQQIKQTESSFAGAVLIGSFPETALVRRWLWKRSDRAVTLNGVAYNTKNGTQATILSMRPELISSRTDVVLCDLDGHWEDLYRQAPFSIESLEFVPEGEWPGNWPTAEEAIETSAYSIGSKRFEDVFFIDDAQYRVEQMGEGRIRFQGQYDLRRPEVSSVESTAANPLAMPDIMVSRINALHVAVSQPPENLDAAGKPTTVASSGASPNSMFQRDPAFELRLLKEYMDRNLAHRIGSEHVANKNVALLTTDLQTPSPNYFAKTRQQLGALTHYRNATAVDFAKFIQTPAIIKGVSAHSNCSVSMLLKGYEASQLDEVTGGQYWNWEKSESGFTPSYSSRRLRNVAHFSLLRALWENGKLAETGPCFYVHGGCEAICPTGGLTSPYNSPGYCDHTQIAESLMYYGNGLALIGRAKIFYDIPRDFGDVFTPEQGVFGDVLKHYFDVESTDSRLARNVASRNRTYFWSILGDWTLKMR